MDVSQRPLVLFLGFLIFPFLEQERYHLGLEQPLENLSRLLLSNAILDVICETREIFLVYHIMGVCFETCYEVKVV